MLTACASSGSDAHVSSAPDPVMLVRTETRTVCPAELTLELGERPAPAGDAVLTGNAAGMAWLSAVLSRLGLLEDRLRDAAGECQ